jgi:hypothetical protein
LERRGAVRIVFRQGGLNMSVGITRGERNRPNLGAPPRKLAAEQEQQVAEWVHQGPDPERHKVVRWRLIYQPGMLVAGRVPGRGVGAPPGDTTHLWMNAH